MLWLLFKKMSDMLNSSHSKNSILVEMVLKELGWRYTLPGLQAKTKKKKKRAHHKYKKNIAMTDCQVIVYPACRQSVIAIFFLYLWCACFFFYRLQFGLHISWAYPSQVLIKKKKVWWSHSQIQCGTSSLTLVEGKENASLNHKKTKWD